MDKQVEYTALRTEISAAEQTIINYRNLLYTITTAVLTFAVNKGDALLFLVPFAAIIPIYLMAMDQVKAMMRKVTYIYVFLEPDTECKWETRLYARDKLHQKRHISEKTSVDSYWGVSICCMALSVFFLTSETFGFKFCLTLCLQIIICVICVFLFFKKRPDYYNLKRKCIAEWRAIQKKEQQDKHAPAGSEVIA